MGEAAMSYLLSQLGYQAPMLLVYLVAFVLALVFMRRASTSCILTLIGVGILVSSMIVITGVQASLIDGFRAGGRNTADSNRLMWIIGLAGSVARAVGLMFLVAAIFVGRRSAGTGWEELDSTEDRVRI
ncbi:MAG: hypothetical protein RJB11_1436 [Planctomycetota bacterium]|jgi:hypothetical protein